MTIVIENNIPVPPKRQSWTAKLNELETGQSFQFDSEFRNSVSNIISNYFKNNTSKRFTISVVNEPHGKARVWRIKDAPKEEQI